MPEHIPVPARINVGPSGKQAFPQPASWGRGESGYFWNYIYKGTKAEVDALIPTLSNLVSFEKTDLLGGLAELKVRTSAPVGGTGGSSGSPIEDIWEYEGNDAEKDLLTADYPNTGTLAQLSKSDKELLKNILDDPGAIGHADTQLFSNADTGHYYVPTNFDLTYSYYLLMKAGVSSFPVRSPVIRHTQIVSNAYTIQASFTNMGRIISTASLGALESVPSTLLFAIPPEPTVSQFIETAGDLKYGWRKADPVVRRQTLTKWQVAQAWQFGLWAVKIHGTVL